jgi:plastocyanin
MSTTSPTSTTTADETKTVSVSIVNFRFESASVTINVGDTIRWTVDSGTHTSTSATGVWNSGSKPTGEGFSFTFNEAGNYSYFCSIHPRMQATITVEE